MRTALMLLLLGGTALAAPPIRDPDWPCQAVKVPALSPGSVWNGPALDPYLATWPKDTEAADLAQRLAQRRVPLEKAVQEIKVFGEHAGDQKQQRLLDLVAGLFSTLNEERSSVVAGLSRFGHRQKELAADLRGTIEQLRTAQDKPDADPTKIAQLTEQVTWGTRVFDQRRTSIRYACDVPNLIEQRLGALAQAIQAALGGA